jgi:hypothetical protein
MFDEVRLSGSNHNKATHPLIWFDHHRGSRIEFSGTRHVVETRQHDLNKSRTLASNAGYGDETCIPLKFAWLMAQSVLEQSRQDFCYAIA